MAERKSRKKTEKLAPVTITAGGRVFELIPPEQWTAQQDDKATGMLLRIAPQLQRAASDDPEDNEAAMAEVVVTLVESGEYRKMLGLSFWPQGEAFDPDRIDENTAFFENARFPFSERLTAATEAVKAFFGSGTS